MLSLVKFAVVKLHKYVALGLTVKSGKVHVLTYVLVLFVLNFIGKKLINIFICAKTHHKHL